MMICIIPLQNLLPLNLIGNPEYRSSGLRLFPPSTLQQWETRLRELAKLVEHSYMQGAVTEPAHQLDDFNSNVADAILEPILSERQAISVLPDHQPNVDGICTRLFNFTCH
jgi:hypothetical protein